MEKEEKRQKEDIYLRWSVYIVIISFLIILLSPNPIPLLCTAVSGLICICALFLVTKSILRAKKKTGKILLLVIIILWGLTVYSSYESEFRIRRRAKVTRTEADIAAFESALQMYKEDWGNYPPSLSPYLLEENKGPYIKGIVNDFWGNEYIYIYPGLHIQDGFDLFSKGKDKASNTPDDINNWDKERAWREEY